MIKRTIEFVTSINAPVFGLMTMIFGFFQIYAKTYYFINPYPIHIVLDIFISVIVAFGFSIATTIIIIHSKSKYTPIVFAIFDFFGYALFFANGINKWYINGEYAKIGGAFFISMLSACIIYYFGEIFLQKIREELEKQKQKNQENKNENNLITQIEKLSLELETQKLEFEKTSKLLDNTTQKEQSATSELEKQSLEVQNLTKELETKIKTLENVTLEVEELKKELDEYFEDKTEKELIKVLGGLKSQYTTKIKKGNIENIEKIKSKGEKIAKRLNLPPVDWDKIEV